VTAVRAPLIDMLPPISRRLVFLAFLDLYRLLLVGMTSFSVQNTRGWLIPSTGKPAYHPAYVTRGKLFSSETRTRIQGKLLYLF
jgi:hypothetical protein